MHRSLYKVSLLIVLCSLYSLVAFGHIAKAQTDTSSIPQDGDKSCTTIIVGKDASADGSYFFGRTDDSTASDVTTVKNNPAFDYGDTFTYHDVYANYDFELPGKGMQYMTAPSVSAYNNGEWGEGALNEMQVGMTATESIYGGDKALAADPFNTDNGIEESVIPNLVMPYATSARQGVEWLGQLIEKYGMAEADAVVLSDQQEMWWMEMYTGQQWAAVRVPDDCYAVVGNDALIGTIDVNDTQNVITSPNLVSFAQDHGFLVEENGKINCVETYAGPKRDYSQIRVWAGRNKFSPTQVGDYDVNTSYDLFMKPDQKISLHDAMSFLGYRYEDLKYNANVHPEVRAVGIGNTAEAHIIQYPPEAAPTLWAALASPEMSVFLPFYSNTYYLEDAFTIDDANYNPDMAYFKFRRLYALGSEDRDGFGKEVKDAFYPLQEKIINDAQTRYEQYVKANKSAQAASQLANDTANEAFGVADELFTKGMTELIEKVTTPVSHDTSDESYADIDFDKTPGQVEQDKTTLNMVFCTIGGFAVGAVLTFACYKLATRKSKKKEQKATDNRSD